MTALLVAVVLIAAAVQRATGMGFAMFLSPFAVLTLGPASGVMLVNALGIASALMVLARVHRDVEWRTVAALTPPTVLGVVVGVAVTQVVASDGAQIAAGATVLLALVVSVLLARVKTVARSPAVSAVAATTSGVMGALAGVGGTPMAALAVLTGWNARPFAATMQPYFALVGAIAITARLAFEPGAWPELAPVNWIWLAVAMLAGLWLAERFTIPNAFARPVIVALAGLGALLAVYDGIWGLMK